MPPTLVVASSSYTVYPGGVIALRCSDWMAGARGTLSSEIDARAISGEAVRDTQTVATSLWADAIGAFQAADDTLEIDLSLLPVEVGMPYLVWFSVLIEGDWESTSEDSRRGSTNEEFVYTCALGWYGDSDHPTDASATFLPRNPRNRAHYTIKTSNVAADVAGTEVIYVRAYSYTDSTTEWLVDQVFLIPYVTSGTKAGEWRAGDFAFFGGGFPILAASQLLDDGTDAGDDNGKFTWHAYYDETQAGLLDDEGGGDYQRKAAYADAEYTLRVIEDDLLYLVNTVPSPDVEATARMYSIHGVNYRAAHTILSDDFSRTVGTPGASIDWGITPEGFGWYFYNNTTQWAWVDGSQGIIQSRSGGGFSPAFLNRYLGSGVLGPNAASISSLSCSFSGVFTVDSPVFGVPPPVKDAFVRVSLDSIAADRNWFLHLDVQTMVWGLYLGAARVTGGSVGNPASAYQFGGDFDISAWFAFGSPIGFRMEKTRYYLRARLWDATGAEPGTWDFEDFLPITSNSSGLLTGVVLDYPYADDFYDAHNTLAQSPVFPSVAMGWSNVNAGWKTYWDDIVLEYDPAGASDSAYAAIEQPEGTKISEIEVPYGAYQMVYWGNRKWTDLLAGVAAYLDFSARAWNGMSAAELQRAETVLYYVRSNHAFVIPMNWRSSTREGGWKRVLKGNT